MNDKPVTRGKILALLKEKGVVLGELELVWDPVQETHTIDGMYWDEWLDAWEME